MDVVSDHSAAMSSSVTVPAGGRLYFDSAFEFENGGDTYFDGGVLEYSTNAGGSWVDAGSLIDAGVNYGGALEPELDFGNPLGSRLAFVGSSFGYTGTRLDLSSLAGQSVRFRFRIGTDESVASLGWLVDNVALYSCAPLSTPRPRGDDFNADGSADVAVYRKSTGTWYVRNQLAVQFGEPGDVAVSGDYDGNGTTDVAVYRPSTSTWYVRNQLAVQFGLAGDLPVPGDYDGDGDTDIAVYPTVQRRVVRAQSTCHRGLRRAGRTCPSRPTTTVMEPIDVAVYRLSTGTWYVRNQFTVQFGRTGRPAGAGRLQRRQDGGHRRVSADDGCLVRAEPVRGFVREPRRFAGAARLQRRRPHRRRGVSAVIGPVVREGAVRRAVRVGPATSRCRAGCPRLRRRPATTTATASPT